MTTKAIPNPETLKSDLDIADVIKQVEEYERIHGAPAAVVKVQNRSFGSYYDITSLKEAIDNHRIWVGCDIYLRHWDKSYFMNLPKDMSGR
jgi:hypothetical protein